MAQNLKTYKQDTICIQHNKKTGEAGTIDIYRGCPGCELRHAPCYAAKGAARVGIDFFSPVERRFLVGRLAKQIERYNPSWVRIGCISDPSLDWETTIKISKLLSERNKISVVVTKVHQVPTDEQLISLKENNTILQLSMSAFSGPTISLRRLEVLQRAVSLGVKTSCRLNSAALVEGGNRWKNQDFIISKALETKTPILETPIRMFKTSPLWKMVDQEKYHNHFSPISGKLDNQMTAGLIIPDSYACFSTCSPIPTKNDPVGCPHQCLTIGDKIWGYLGEKNG